MGIDDSQRRAAKVAGFAQLLALALVVYANYGIHGRLVNGAHRATAAENIAAAESLFRLGIVCDLLYCAGLVVVLAALYVILRPVSLGLALLASLCRLVYASLWVLITLELTTALRLATGTSYLRALGAERVQALVALHLGGGTSEYYVGLFFWGLGSTVASYLWLRSRYIPRGLAWFGLVSSVVAVASALAYFAIPNFTRIVNAYWYDSGLGLFDVALSLWLLFKGLRTPAESPL
jgi:hypothetical protein